LLFITCSLVRYVDTVTKKAPFVKRFHASKNAALLRHFRLKNRLDGGSAPSAGKRGVYAEYRRSETVASPWD